MTKTSRHLVAVVLTVLVVLAWHQSADATEQPTCPATLNEIVLGDGVAYGLTAPGQTRTLSSWRLTGLRNPEDATLPQSLHAKVTGTGCLEVDLPECDAQVDLTVQEPTFTTMETHAQVLQLGLIDGQLVVASECDPPPTTTTTSTTTTEAPTTTTTEATSNTAAAVTTPSSVVEPPAPVADPPKPELAKTGTAQTLAWTAAGVFLILLGLLGRWWANHLS